MADNISTEYNMVEILQGIGRSFFPTDISEERLGTFGFITEGMANIYGSAILDANLRASEYYTAKAKKMDTLLNEAETLGVVIDNTTPALMNAYLVMKTADIRREENVNIDSRGYYTYHFVLEKDMAVNISGYQFMLEWDILITAKQVGGSYVYSARYLTEGDVDPHDNDTCSGHTYIKDPTISTLHNKYIQISIVTSSSTGVSTGEPGELLMLNVNLRQMEKKYDYYVVTETDMISLTGIEFTYDDYLSHFNIFYRESQNSEWEYVRPITMYDTAEYTDKTAQYSIDRDSKVITLNLNQFITKYNGEFRIDIYTTKGSLGNITYTGDGSDILVALDSYDDRHIYSGIDVICTPISSAVGGVDTVGLEEVRAKVIRAKATHKSLNTDYDIENFLRDHDIINDYYCIKRRSDILETIYGAFTILRNTDGDIIPTNTLDLLVKCENNPTDGVHTRGTESTTDSDIEYLTIEAGTALIGATDYTIDNVTKMLDGIEVLPEEEKRFIVDVLNRTTYPNPATLEKTTKVFGLPFTIVYDVENELATLYMSSINKNIPMSQMELKEDKQTPTNFAIDHINISRNSLLGEDSYTITVSVMASGDYSNCYVLDDSGNPTTDANDQIIVNSGIRENALMLKGFIYNNEDETKIDSFFDFDFVSAIDGIFTFEAKIPVSDCVNIHTGKLSIPSSEFMYVCHSPNIIQDSEIITEETSDGVYKYFRGIDTNSDSYIDITDLKIGIGTYYIQSNLTKTDRIGSPLTSLSSTSENSTIYTDSDGYPEFRCKIGDDVYAWELTDIYTNNGNFVDLYTDMSYVIRCSTVKRTIDKKRYVLFRELPVLQYSKAIDILIANRVTDIIRNTKDVLDEMNLRLNNSFSIDYKFFRTYGPCKYFKLQKTYDSNSSVDLNALDITIEFNCRPKSGITSTDAEIVNAIKPYLKSYIENLNSDEGNYTRYISNIITSIETTFKDTIQSIELVGLNRGINEYNDNYRVLLYDKPNIETYQYANTDEGRKALRYFVPEYVNLPLENITINIIR